MNNGIHVSNWAKGKRFENKTRTTDITIVISQMIAGKKICALKHIDIEWSDNYLVEDVMEDIIEAIENIE